MDEPTNTESTVREPDAAGDPGLTVPLNGDDPARVVAGVPGETIPDERIAPPLPTIQDRGPGSDRRRPQPHDRAERLGRRPRRRLDRGQDRLPPGRPGGRRRPGPAAGAGLRDPRGAGPRRYGRRLQGARQVNLNRICALKMILAGAHAGPEAAARFLSEAETVARLEHPAIVQIHHLGDHDGRPYLELEYVDGGSLDDRSDGTPLPAGEAAELVEALARAIHYSHGLGVVHRDLKPSNILLTQDGRAKIADFGLAKMLDTDSRITGSGLILGTPSYMAPEQASGETRGAGPSADIYALGAILYALLTGRPPFRAATIPETLRQVREEAPVSPCRLQPSLPRDVETITLKCLQKRPADRYATAAALAEDLRRFRAREPILARPIPAWERGLKSARRRPWAAGMAAALLACVLCLLGAGGLFVPADQPEPGGREAGEHEGQGGPRHRRGRDVSRPGQRRRGPPPGAPLGLARRGHAGPRTGGFDGRLEAGRRRPSNRRGPLPRRDRCPRGRPIPRPRRGRPLARLQPRRPNPGGRRLRRPPAALGRPPGATPPRHRRPGRQLPAPVQRGGPTARRAIPARRRHGLRHLGPPRRVA